MGYVLSFDEERCIGCYACHTACISTHEECKDSGQSFRTMKRFLREEEGYQKTICPGCTHCGTCADVCPVHAVYRDVESGLIQNDRNLCIGCGKCASACPQGVIWFDRENKMRKCDGCIRLLQEGKRPACVTNCCVGAIALEEREGD